MFLARIAAPSAATRTLPRLAPGVLVHVHDIATSFEYTLEWYDEGRAWNEAPALRAFLAFNQGYEVLYLTEAIDEATITNMAKVSWAGQSPL